MKKKISTIIVCLLTAIVFVGCASPSAINIAKKEYDGVVSLNGYSTVVKDGAQMQLYKDGKPVGEKAFYIYALERSGIFTGFYEAKRTAKSGLELMDKDGNFLQSNGLSANVTSISVNGTAGKDDKGFSKYDVHSFTATIATDDINNKALMNLDGSLQSGRYSSLSRSYSYADSTYTYYNTFSASRHSSAGNEVLNSVIKLDGTRIGREIISSEGSIEIINGVDNQIIAIPLVEDEDGKNEDELGNTHQLYSADGTALSVAESWYGAATHLGEDVFGFTKITEDGDAIYFIKNDYSVTEYEDLYNYYIYDNELYYIERNEDGKSRIVKASGGYTSDYYEDINIYTTDFLIFTKGTGPSAERIIAKKDGTVLANGLASNAVIVNYVITEKDSIVVIRSDNKLIASVNGTKKEYTTQLSGYETLTWYNGAVLIYSSADYSRTLWIPYTNKTAKLDSITSDSDCYMLTVKGEDKNSRVMILGDELKYWDGTLANKNLLVEFGLNTSDLSNVTYAYINTSSTMTESAPIAKMASYDDYNAIEKAIEDNTINFASGNLAYYLNGSYNSKDFIAYGTKNGELTYKPLEKNYSYSSYRSEFPYITIHNSTTELSNIYKLSVENDNVVMTEVMKDVYNASVNSDAMFNYYINSSLPSGHNEIYNLDGTLLLSSNFVVASIQNNIAVVSTVDLASALSVDTPMGIIKLDGKGGYKIIKNIELYGVQLFPDGSFTAKNSIVDVYSTLYDAKGKAIESKVVMLDYNLNASYALEQIRSGKKEVTVEMVLALPNGKSKIATYTLTEDMLDVSIINCLS